MSLRDTRYSIWGFTQSRRLMGTGPDLKRLGPIFNNNCWVEKIIKKEHTIQI